MPNPVAADDLMQRIPTFLRRVAELDAHSITGISEALAASELELPDRAGDCTYLRFQHLGYDDQASFERRLRSAITRVLGKPSGSDKRWDAGCAVVTLSCGQHTIRLSVRPQFSMTNLRTAAAAWLEGTELRRWLVESQFVDSGVEPTAEGNWPRPENDLTSASVRTTEDRPANVSFFMDPGVRPPGMKSTSDDERFDQILTFLAERLGEPDRPGWWHRGSRSFSIRRMHSYTRSIHLVEAPAGKVSAPHGGYSTIPTSPDPDPRAAAELLRTLAPMRGMTLDSAATSLVAAGAVTDAPPRRRYGAATLTCTSGRPVDIDVVDGRFAGAVVEVTSARAAKDVVEPVFTEAFGAPETVRFETRWRLGPMVIGYAGSTGDEGFERLQAAVSEDTSSAVEGARSWLLEGEPLGDVQVRDVWHGRCVGAAISAAIVPPVAVGQPIWCVDGRLLWLQDGRLQGAEHGAWPPWAVETPLGGDSSPLSPTELAAFLDVVAGWRDATLDDAAASLVALRWATTDPDTVTQSVGTSAALRLRRPAGSALGMTLVDGRIRRWKICLGRSKDPSTVAPVERSLKELLASSAHDRGVWTLGEFRAAIPGGVRLDGGKTLTLQGTR